MTLSAPTSSAQVEKIAQERLLAIAKDANTVGELRSNVQKNVKDTINPQGQEELQKAFQKQAKELMEASKGYDAVRLKNLEGNIQGQNLVGGSQVTASIDREMAANATEMKRVLKHEADAKVGHSSQALPRAIDHKAALVIDGQTLSTTAVLEGDVERGVSIAMGEGKNGKRPGQPKEEYEEGQKGANRIIDLVGEKTWNDHLKKDGANAGDLSHLQQKIFEAKLQKGESVEKITEQAKETGNHRAAMQALMMAA